MASKPPPPAEIARMTAGVQNFAPPLTGTGAGVVLERKETAGVVEGAAVVVDDPSTLVCSVGTRTTV